MSALLDIKTQLNNIDERVSVVESAKASNIEAPVVEKQRESNQGMVEQNLTAATATESSEPEVTPTSLRQDMRVMAAAAQRIARIKEEQEEGDYLNDQTRSNTGGKKSGSVMLASDAVLERIDWPHLYVRRVSGGKRKSVPYAELRIEEFVYGFISMIESPKCKWDYRTMARILRVLMQDTMDYSWSNALDFYKMIGLDVEQGIMSWEDHDIIRDMRLTYSRAVYPEKKENTFVKTTKPAPKTAPAGMKCCLLFQTAACDQTTDHGQFTHACNYCFQSCATVCRHPESQCIRKVTDSAKNPKRRE